MADIDIERKGPPFWPWLVGLLAVLVVVWIWAAGDRGDEYPTETIAERTPSPGTPAGTMGTTGAIDEYVQFAGDTGTGATAETPGMGREHEYTAEGIRKLRAALEALVEQKPNADARGRLDGFRQAAERIQQDPTSMQHASQVRDAFTSAAEVIASVEGASADQVKATAASISADQPLLDQRDKVHSFFRQSAEAIQQAAG